MSAGLARDLAQLDAAAPYTALVSLRDGLDPSASLVGLAGIEVVRSYPLVSAAFVAGTVGSIAALTANPAVVYMEDNRVLAYAGDTGPWSSRVRIAQEPIAGGPYRDASNRVLLGDGVGVAIVDSGINTSHPDLTSRVARNFKIVCSTPGLIHTTTETCYGNKMVDDGVNGGRPTFGYVDVPAGTTSDTSSGHGTHVAGIVAGTGAASTGTYPAGTAPAIAGTFTGVAPNATLYGYGTGEVISVLFAIEAHYHILENGSSFTPAIKVVNNSWGDSGGIAYDSSSIGARLNAALVADGVTMVYSAGNDGGNGSDDATSSTCDDPTPGVICVANYDDLGTGGRNHLLDVSSSRGKATVSNTWPDVSAPGAYITSSCVRQVQPICNLGYVDESRWAPWYGTISGTSMAAPHVAGAAALLLQASPTLTPAQIENVLQDTAHKFTAGASYVSDPQNTGGTTSYDKGAGLIDVKAALDNLGVSHGTGSAPSGYAVFAGDSGDFTGPGAADIVSLHVTQTTGSSGAAGIRYAVGVRNATDLPPAQSVTLRLYQSVGGVAYVVNVLVAPSGASAGAATPVTATAEDVTRAGNTVSFFLPFSKLGSPGVGEPFIGTQMASYIGTAVDAAPGNDQGLAQLLVRPMYGRPFARG
ncbi:MAG TPA: S8 family serine peptidase [Acidimicrobiales bacterium]